MLLEEVGPHGSRWTGASRARIASDLHDGIGPRLFALQAAIAQAERAAKDAQRRAPDDTNYSYALRKAETEVERVEKKELFEEYGLDENGNPLPPAKS